MAAPFYGYCVTYERSHSGRVERVSFFGHGTFINVRKRAQFKEGFLRVVNVEGYFRDRYLRNAPEKKLKETALTTLDQRQESR